MDRYYVEKLGGRGWITAHFVCDRSTVPHMVLAMHKTRAKAVRQCADLNATAGDWAVQAPEADSLTRLRDWASRTKAFTEAPYDPNAEPALVRAAA